MTRSALQAGFRMQLVVERDGLFHPLNALVFLRETRPQKERAKQSDQSQWKKPAHSSSSRQAERYQRVAEGFVVFVAATRRDYDELFARSFPIKGHRRGVSARREFRDPKLLACLFIKRPEAAVIRGGDENQSARRHNRTTEIRRAGWRNATFFQGFNDAER